MDEAMESCSMNVGELLLNLYSENDWNHQDLRSGGLIEGRGDWELMVVLIEMEGRKEVCSRRSSTTCTATHKHAIF